MKRHTLLVVAFAILFGSRAPLCFYACLEGATPSPAAEHAAGDPAPCHGGAPNAPDAPQPSDHACVCDTIVVPKGEVEKPATGTLKMPAALLAMVTLPIVVEASSSPTLWRRHESLPRPDILLLKSTLLL